MTENPAPKTLPEGKLKGAILSTGIHTLIVDVGEETIVVPLTAWQVDYLRERLGPES